MERRRDACEDDRDGAPPVTRLAPITRRLGITPRQHALAGCVPHGTRVFVDVGTNHGILPITVLRQLRVQRCVAVDKSLAALRDARRRLRRSGVLDRVALCAGDGLLPIDLDQVDAVCVAGLGPRVVTAILADSWARLRERPVRLVLNPFGSSDAVRAFLAAQQTPLVMDFVVTERGRDYTILVAQSGG